MHHRVRMLLHERARVAPPDERIVVVAAHVAKLGLSARPVVPAGNGVAAKDDLLADRASHQCDDARNAAVVGKVRRTIVKPDARPAAGQANQLRGDDMRSLVNRTAPSIRHAVDLARRCRL